MLAAMPVVARLCGPHEFGQYQLAFTASILVAICLTTRIEYRLPALREDDRVRSYMAAIRVLRVASVLGFVVVLAGQGSDILVFVGVTLIMASAYGLTLVDGGLFAEARFASMLATRNLLTGLLTALFQVAFLFLHSSYVSLAIATVVARMISVMVTRRRAKSELPGLAPGPAFGALAAGRTPREIVSTAGGSVVSNAVPFAPLVVGSIYLSAGDVGQYALAQRVAVVPVSIMGLALAQIVAIRVGVVVREGGDSVVSVLARQICRIGPLGLICGVALAVAGGPAFAVVFGPHWAGAGDAVVWLAPALALQIVVSPMMSVFGQIQSGHWFLAVELASLTLVSVSVLACANYFGTLPSVVAAASFSIAVGQVIAMVTLLRAASIWDRRRDF